VSGGCRCETRRTPSGTGMQQARDSSAEQAVEVVQNHEDGTCRPGGTGRPKSVATLAGVDADEDVGRGAIHTTNLTRGKSRGSGQPHPTHFGPIRAALEMGPSTRGAHEPGKTLRTRLETSKVERGAARSDQLLPRPWPEPTALERSQHDRRTLKYTPTITRAATTSTFGSRGEPDRQREPLKRRPIGR
jgi:hypothetical protein